MIECISAGAASRPRCPNNEFFEQTVMTVLLFLVLAALMSLVIAQISREEDGHISIDKKS